MINPILGSTPNIDSKSSGSSFVPSTKFIRITSVVLITLSILAVVGSCAGLILTTSLWFLLLSVAAGLCLSLGIIINFTVPVKTEAKMPIEKELQAMV
ncbi:hypothetical protein O1W69_04320 [Chlamydia sp. 12-01]|uniref:hypothetical protein n=1 Tax=Chlamydia sp. 12-01 TaxID=3002742 RepID=UPI0035D4C678